MKTQAYLKRGGTKDIEAEIARLLREHGELYGLQLVKLSRGKLKRGTVYVHLHRLADKGLVGSRVTDVSIGELRLPLRIFFQTTPGGTGERAAAELTETRLQLEGATA